MSLDRSTKLDRYEILEAIGAGGIGEVYTAIDTHLNRSVTGRQVLRSRSVVGWNAAPIQAPVGQPFMQFSVDLGPDAVAGARITAAISPEGTRLAYVVRGRKGAPQLVTRPLNQVNATPLSGTDSADLLVSPDGRWTGFLRRAMGHAVAGGVRPRRIGGLVDQ
jgi:hypothetical protein